MAMYGYPDRAMATGVQELENLKGVLVPGAHHVGPLTAPSTPLQPGMTGTPLSRDEPGEGDSCGGKEPCHRT